MSKARVQKMTVSLDPELIQLLTRLSKALGMSRSSCLNSLLKGMSGTLETMAIQLEQLRDLSQKQRDQLSIELALVEQQALQQQSETSDLSKSLTSLIHAAKFSEL